MTPTELLQDAAEAWDWLEQQPDAPYLLRIYAAVYILRLLSESLTAQEWAAYPLLQARLHAVRESLRFGIDTFRAWWQQARPLLLQEPTPNRRLC